MIFLKLASPQAPETERELYPNRQRISATMPLSTLMDCTRTLQRHPDMPDCEINLLIYRCILSVGASTREWP
jgi:hypothetical protein